MSTRGYVITTVKLKATLSYSALTMHPFLYNCGLITTEGKFVDRRRITIRPVNCLGLGIETHRHHFSVVF